MSDSDRELAKNLKSEYAVLDGVSVETIAVQIRSLRASGVAEERINTLIPKLFRLKETVDEKAEEQSSLSPREIRIDSLPDELDRDNWR